MASSRTRERETAPAVSRLLALWRETDESTRERGRRWYSAAAREVARIAAETGRTRAQVAAVLAITSPDAQLATNLAWTLEACRNGGRTAGRYPNGQRPKVRAALASTKPREHVRGPKVRAFYDAIRGDTDAFVLDRWTCHTVGLDRFRAPTRTERREVEAAYREAAAIVGEHVRDLQAALWLHVRERTPRSDGRVHRLADVTL